MEMLLFPQTIKHVKHTMTCNIIYVGVDTEPILIIESPKKDNGKKLIVQFLYFRVYTDPLNDLVHVCRIIKCNDRCMCSERQNSKLLYQLYDKRLFLFPMLSIDTAGFVHDKPNIGDIENFMAVEIQLQKEQNRIQLVDRRS